MSLGNVNRQISVIIASFQYIKNNLVNAANENINLDPEQRKSYEEELRKTQKTLKLVKNEMIRFKKLAYKVIKKNTKFLINYEIVSNLSFKYLYCVFIS